MTLHHPVLIDPLWRRVVTPRMADGIVLSKKSGTAIKVDPAQPTYTWQDIIGYTNVDATGANAASLNAFRGGSVRRWAFSAGDKIDFEYHIPHDYAGTDLYVHVHWAHNATSYFGNFVCDMAYTYAKGHNQQNYAAEKTVTLTVSGLDVGTMPQYRHRVDEVQLTSAGGSATLWDTAEIEVDGVIALNLTATTIPTLTGGSPNEPFIFSVDVHYQSTNIGTKAKAPNFYV